MQSLDKNGAFLQRRKMYIGLPLHNMKSKLRFDWQNEDPSVQDQVGSRFKIKQENELIRKKYAESLDKRIRHKYVDHEEELPFVMRREHRDSRNAQEDTLAKEVENFNTSKIIPQPEKPQEEQIDASTTLLQGSPGAEKYNRTGDRLSQSYNAPNPTYTPSNPTYSPPPPVYIAPSPSPPPPSPRQPPEQQPYYEPERERKYSYRPSYQAPYDYRYDRPAYEPAAYERPPYSNPENYYTISPAPDRYRPFQPEVYPGYASPSKYAPKPYSGSMPSDYPFRNVIPDKLEHHLRGKTKADPKALKVSLNLYDYHKP